MSTNIGSTIRVVKIIELVHVKHLGQSLAHNQLSINGYNYHLRDRYVVYINICVTHATNDPCSWVLSN